MNRSALAGAILTLVATLFYSIQTAIVKAYASSLPPLSVVIFVQSALSMILILPIMFRHGISPGIAALKTQYFRLQILRTIFSLALSFLLYYAVRFIPLVDAVLLANSAPLMVPIMAYLIYKQPINKKFWLPALVGFIGVLVILQPDVKIANTASLLAFAGAVCIAISLVLVRHMPHDSSDTIAFYFFALSTVFSGIIAYNQWQPFKLQLWTPMIVIGVTYFLFQYLVTCALKLANPRLVGSLLYSSVAYSVLISALVWHRIPNLISYFGIALVVISGIACIQIEAKAKD
jgi:drug/metabolite transporter (DMT)-like permease